MPYWKVIETPTYFEVWETKTPAGGGARQKEDPMSDAAAWVNMTEEERRKLISRAEERGRRPTAKESYEAERERAARRESYYKNLRWEIARILDCNWGDGNDSDFITCTYAEHVDDVGQVARDWRNFMLRLSWHLHHSRKNTMKYLMVEEWTKGKNDAAKRLHIHAVLFEMPFVRKSELERLWGHGFVHINRVDVDTRENVGRYISKYMAKEAGTRRPKEKSYRCSRNLKRPEVRRFQTIEELDPAELGEVVYSKEYEQTIRDFQARDGEPFTTRKVRYTKVRKGKGWTG